MLDSMVEGLEAIDGRWVLGAAVVVGLAKGGRGLAKGAIKGYLAARDGMTRASAGSRRGWRDLYAEAEAEYRAERLAAQHAQTASAEAPAVAESRRQPMKARGEALTPSREAA
jgi:hypothetical protein